MTVRNGSKPRPVFRLVFFLVGMYFVWDIYLAIVTGRADEPGGYFRYLFLEPGLAFFFCGYMTWGSNWWRILPKWMMGGGARDEDAGGERRVGADDERGDV